MCPARPNGAGGLAEKTLKPKDPKHDPNHKRLRKGDPRKVTCVALVKGRTAGILSLAGYSSAAPLGSEKYTYSEVVHDVVESPNTTQGGMSLWSRYGTDYGTDIGTGVNRTGRTCTNSIYNGGTVSKATWAFDMGVNFIPMRLKTTGGTEYLQWPSARGATSIQMHPEGEEYETHGCVGFIGYANAESFRYFFCVDSAAAI